MQAALTLKELGMEPVIVEKDDALGGKLRLWDRLFPTMTPAGDVLGPVLEKVKNSGIEVLTSAEIISINNGGSEVVFADGWKMNADAVVIASGFDIFDAEIKEEYGYNIYDNVISSVDLESMFKTGKVLTKQGTVPKTVAFLHCVGSRDEKVCQRHCSRVCCITGVKQAIEMKQAMPDVDIYNFYMDMRMFGPGYEELYRQAQYEYNIHFVRGRISEAAQTGDGMVQIKAEDTLVSRPMKMTVDMLVLIVGMKPGASNMEFSRNVNIDLYPSGFLKPVDSFAGNVNSDSPRIFYAGTATAPKNIGESINEGIAAAYKAAQALNAI